MARADRIQALEDGLAARDWQTVRDAVEEAAEYLGAHRAIADERLDVLVSRLAALTTHSKWEVRCSVARTAAGLDQPELLAACAPLVQDENSFVREAAQRALALRTSRPDVLEEQHDAVWTRWLEDFGERHGDRAKNEVRRIAEKFTELVFREAYHEIVKATSPLEMSLKNLARDLTYRRIPRRKCIAHVKRADRRVKLLLGIIKSVRDLMVEVKPEFKTEDVREIVTEAAALVRDRNRGKKRRPEFELEVPNTVKLEVDRTRILQALTNVLQNAVEAYDGLADREPRISIRARVDEPNRTVILTVSDRGSGMSEEALTDAFRLYASKKPEGLGFGLPFARRIIENEHAGTIRLASKKGEGTTVTIALALEQETKRSS